MKKLWLLQFIANALLQLAPAVDTELTEEYQGFLRSLARR